MRILATDFFDTTYIFFLSSNFFFFLLKQDAYTIKCQDFGGKDTEVNQPGWVVVGQAEGYDSRGLTCHFFIWFVHGLELLQQGGGGDDAG